MPGRTWYRGDTADDVLPAAPGRLRPASLEGVTLMVRAAPGVDALSAVRREISHWTPISRPSTPGARRSKSAGRRL